jgi:hypothetical protein
MEGSEGQDLGLIRLDLHKGRGGSGVSESSGGVIYGVRWEAQAERDRDSLPEDRRKLLYEGLRIIAVAPYAPPSRPVRGDERTRNALVTQGIMVQYVISEAEVVILVIHIIDGSDGMVPLV